MDYISDLHLHSHYSRAVSPAMNLVEMAKWARWKGLDILSTCDWTHPVWLREIKSQLEETSEGLFQLKTSISEQTKAVRFLLSTEIACIYSQGGRVRRIHNLIFSPSFATVEKINSELLKRGCNLSADGRPIIGLSSKQLLELALGIDKRVIFIPCHVWTPHFGIYGSASGFDSLQEAFGDFAKHIYGVETGLSSDPLMNWQIKELVNRSILSFSDAHSLPKMGREATVFSVEKSLQNLTYTDIGKAIVCQVKKGTNGLKGTSGTEETNEAKKDVAKVAYTIEFYPEEGKYHYTGHRNCGVSKTPEEIKKDGDICPVCSRRLTEGVMYRVEQIGGKNSEFNIKSSDLDENGVFWIKDPSGSHPPFVKLVPLNEIIAESLNSPVTSFKVKDEFVRLCELFGSEITILLKTPLDDLKKQAGEKITDGVKRVRAGEIVIKPGFDGEYGHISIWPEKEVPNETEETKENSESQLGLDF